MKTKSPVAVIYLIVALGFLTGCQQSSTQNTTVEEFNIESVPALSLDGGKQTSNLRIVAVGNGSAEILVSLGLGSQIVGRDIASEIELLKEIPIVTNGHDLDSEKILAVRPDILFIDSNSSPKSVANQVANAGVQVVEISESFSIQGIAKKVEQISSALATQSRGQELIEKIADQIELIAQSEENEKKEVVFLYLRGSNGIFLVGGPGSGADSLIQAAGAIDLGVERYKNPFNPINSEAVAGLKPDYYLLMSAGLKSVGGLEKFRSLPGINPIIPVITVNDSLLLSFGPRTPALIQELYGIFYGKK